MKTVVSLVTLFAAIGKAVAFDSWRFMRDIIRLLHAILLRCLARFHLNHNEKSRDPSHCTPIKRPEFNRPDPLIYSQSYLMSLGFAVTWDNPDITLQKVAGPLDQNAPPDPALTVPSSSLEADTEYDVVARIWNGSPSAPVVGLGVKFTQHGFGIGVAQQAIGSATANLGVKGGAGCPAYARTRWKTPKKKGHYCLQILLEWFDDLNPANNLGQENTNVGTAQSPAKFVFALGNQQRQEQTFRFEADAFALQQPGVCDVEDVRRRRERNDHERRAREARNAPVTAGRPETFAAIEPPLEQTRAGHPLPEGWKIEFKPDAPTLAPGAEMEIAVTITPPDSFSGRQPINVNAFNAFGLAGGVTFQVEKA